jgi:hypothetical protein
VTINGQKAAWVSNGTIAEYAALFCACNRGQGLEVVSDGILTAKPREDLILPIVYEIWPTRSMMQF